MTALVTIEGIGETYQQKLQAAGVDSIETLREKCATPAGRKELAEATEISSKLILKWANRADLSRIKGIGTQYADLLELAGVDTVPELAQRKAENLHQAMANTNVDKEAVRRLPTLAQVSDWIEQAKNLPRLLTY